MPGRKRSWRKRHLVNLLPNKDVWYRPADFTNGRKPEKKSCLFISDLNQMIYLPLPDFMISGKMQKAKKFPVTLSLLPNLIRWLPLSITACRSFWRGNLKKNG